jgi:hypothetical protein
MAIFQFMRSLRAGGRKKGNQSPFLIFFPMVKPVQFFEGRVFSRWMSFWGLLSMVLVACSLFETQPFYPTPFQTGMMDLAPSSGEPRVFQFEEFWQVPDQGRMRDTLVYSGTLEWTYLGNQPSGAGIRIERKALSDGTLGRRTDTAIVSVNDEGFAVTAQEFLGGGILPILRESQEAPEPTWNILPAHMQLGDQWRWVRGGWVCTQSVSGMDTLALGGDLFQAWKVGETLAESGEVVSTGTYWFSKEGLLKAEWVWPSFEWTDAQANSRGQMGFKRVLRRKF